MQGNAYVVKGINGRLGLRGHDGCDGLSIPVQYQRGNHFNIFCGSHQGCFVNVQLGDHQTLALFLSYLFVGRGDPAAVAAPGCPVVHQHYFAGLQIVLKFFFVQIDCCHNFYLLFGFVFL